MNGTKTRRVLLAWELGSGFGHAQRLLTAAQALQAVGWQPIVAARHITTLSDEHAASGIPLLQAPMHVPLAPKDGSFRALTYADIMAIAGYGRLDALRAITAGWDALIDLVCPAVIIADYSPFLTLAAYGKVPVIAFGDGFVIPPPTAERFSNLRNGGEPFAPQEQILETVREVQRRRGLPAPPSLPALVGGNDQVVCTFPELDPYRPTRMQAATGPVAEMPLPLAPAPEPGLFVYLAADFPATRKVLQTVINSKVRASGFVRDAQPDFVRALERNGMRIYTTPPPLPEVMQAASVILHHGGVGTSEMALCLGRPQVLLPRHLEQRLNANALQAAGTARVIRSDSTLEASEAVIRASLVDRALSKRAEAIAQTLQQRRPWPSLQRLLILCDLLAREGACKQYG